MSIATAAAATPRPLCNGRQSASPSEWVMPAFLETAALCRLALSEITGERCSKRRAEKVADYLFSVWRGDEVPALHSDPTAELAIKNVMKEMQK